MGCPRCLLAAWTKARLTLRPSSRVAASLLLLGFLSLPATGDGGKLILQGQSAGETISLFADPYPVRAGEACDFSVLVQRGEEPVQDGSVRLSLGSQSFALSHKNATNKLLFAGTAAVPTAGTLDVAVTHERSLVAGQLDVAGASAPVLSYWPYFAVLPIAAALFVLNRYLKRQRERITSV